jgi:hypothetical protein
VAVASPQEKRSIRGWKSAISLENVGAGFLSLRQCPSPELSLVVEASLSFRDVLGR